jgi:hypothetical protein
MLNAGLIGAGVGSVPANVALAAGLGTPGGLLGHQIRGAGV